MFLNIKSFVYHKWIRSNKVTIKSTINDGPFFTVIIPVYNVKSLHLRKAIISILRQTYNKFELILIDINTSNKKIERILFDYKNKENVKTIYITKNKDILNSINYGIKHSIGDYIIFVDCKDMINKDALYFFAKEIIKNDKLDFLYSDEDKITDLFSIRHDPFFKPDWSYDSFMSMNYIDHLACYKSSVIKKLTVIKGRHIESQHYDLNLKMLQNINPNSIKHICKILYHRRYIKNSTENSINYINNIIKEIKESKKEYLKNINCSAKIIELKNTVQTYFKYDVINNPLVSIIIPSKNNFQMLKKCINSIITNTNYSNYEIIVVDNGSAEENKKNIFNYLNSIKIKNKYYYKKFQFNYSKMINIGINNSNGEYILTLNDDVEIERNDWLSTMLGQCQQKGVGVVGAKLLYSDGILIQHQGIFINKKGPFHDFCNYKDSELLYHHLNKLPINCIATTGACSMFSKKLIDKIGLLNEKFPVAYNDVDFCLRAFEAGYRNVSRNDIYLIHHESVSRGLDYISPEKTHRLKNDLIRLEKIHKTYMNDIYLNSNLISYCPLLYKKLPKRFVFLIKLSKFLKQKNRFKYIIKKSKLFKYLSFLLAKEE